MEPAVPIKPAWTSATFLQYLGIAVAGGSVLWLLSVLRDEHGTGGLLGWSLLALVVFGVAAEAARRRGDAVGAGLLAVVTVVVFGVAVFSLVDLVGLDASPGDGPDFFSDGFPVGLLVVEGALVAAALAGLARFRFPLLALVAAVVLWYGTMDLLEGVLGGGDTATALLALVIGLVYGTVGAAFDLGTPHPYAMWLHVVAGLSIGGAVLTWFHAEWWEWLVVLAVSLAYVLVARALGRSSWAVLGAAGVLATATYFVERWFSFGDLVPFFPADTEDVEEWARPLVYIGVGAGLFLLGLGVGRRRAVEPAPPPPEVPA